MTIPMQQKSPDRGDNSENTTQPPPPQQQWQQQQQQQQQPQQSQQQQSQQQPAQQSPSPTNTPQVQPSTSQQQIDPNNQAPAPSPGPPVESGQGDGSTEVADDQEPEFPQTLLAKLDDMINRPRWIVPVLPKGELEVLLEAAIELSKKGLDTRSESCQRFFREGLTTSFTKVLTDEAVNGWKYEIHKYILRNAEKLIELIVVKLLQDWFPLLELLAMVLNPQCKFHQYNGSRPSESVPAGSQPADDELFARPPDARSPRVYSMIIRTQKNNIFNEEDPSTHSGWLVDLVNRFGQMDGFQSLLNRFTSGVQLSVPVIAALIKPFGLCADVLTPHTIQKYFMPLVDIIPNFLDSLTDEELKKESKSEMKNDALSSIIKSLKQLVARVPGQEETIKTLEIFRLKMILRLLQISSFNGKMNALNEVNKVIANVSFHVSRHSQVEDEWLTAEKMAEWIQQKNVLSIVLRDSLHQPQYVEKLEKILRFMIKEKALTVQDLDKIWEAQAGKHEAIEKNVHDLLTKLAWDFSPEQLDHLFECFQASWTNAIKKQREKLLELIRRLAEDDKEGIMAHKVLGLLWNLAHSKDVPTEIMDQALNAHIKILEFSCSQDRDSQKIFWINKFVEELKNDKWVLPALKQIREICQLFQESPQNYPHTQRTPHVQYRNYVINQLQNTHCIVMLLAQNLSAYMEKARAFVKDNPDAEEPVIIVPDGSFNHVQQVQERLKFLRFLLKDGQLWLCDVQARQIWNCLAENAIYLSDREACFKWFAKLMGDEPDLDPEITRDFFESNILLLNPSLLTENGMNCFERFFQHVNLKEGKLVQKRRGGFMMDDLELIGLEYLWRVVLWSPDEVAEKAIKLLKDTYTNLGTRLQSNQVAIHEDFIQSCVDRLKASFDTITILEQDPASATRMIQEAQRMVQVLTVLKEYVAECDDDYAAERSVLPLSRACRGKFVVLVVRFPSQGRQVDDIEIWSHTNDTIGSIRRQILQRVKPNNANLKVDLYINGETLDPNEDKRLVSQLQLRDKPLITAKLVQVSSNMPSSPDSSSDSSTGSPHNVCDGPNVEAENCLPGVLMSHNPHYAQFLFQLIDLGSHLQLPRLRDTARHLLMLMPADAKTVDNLREVCQSYSMSALEGVFFGPSPAKVLYSLEVSYCLLMPAHDPLCDEAFLFQNNFLRSGGVSIALNMLTKNNFMSNADLPTRRSAYVTGLKLCKLMLTTVAHAKLEVLLEPCKVDTHRSLSPQEHSHVVILQQSLPHIPNASTEFTVRKVSVRLAHQLRDKITNVIPDLNTVKAMQKIAWSSSSGSLHLVHASNEDIHKAHEKGREAKGQDCDDEFVAKEALEVLTICLVLCPSALEALNNGNKHWQFFIVDLLLLCKRGSIRGAAAEQFFLVAIRCCFGDRPLVFFILLLFTVLLTTAKDNPRQSEEYFKLLCRLLNYACGNDTRLANADVLLHNEISWLKKVRDNLVNTGGQQVEDTLLEGHLGLTRELLSFQCAEKKFFYGSDSRGTNLIKELVEDFIFPASTAVIQYRKQTDGLPAENSSPVCTSPNALMAAYELLVALSTGCLKNLSSLAELVIDMYYKDDNPLSEWEYLPPVGPRPLKGFVGLKNAGATCYMNSVLQQLFMIEPIRLGILAAEGAADDVEEDFGEEKAENEQLNVEIVMTVDDERKDEGKPVIGSDEERKDYHLGIMKQVQIIFGHLASSRLQYYVPRGFWKHFKLWGEPVNLREQHDALEFFNSLVDSIDEALKILGQPSILSKVLGGTFADQKICKDCPHRYQREEAFTTLNIDIRNHQNLVESLEQYVKGDLLEGANAYHCDKCSKKVDTVKRLVIWKLPKILAIQLKRFDYDWERECAIKFNDYFEFPREIDMEPYTVQGLARIEGETIDENFDRTQSTKYKLVGVVVHSGQASGGHYYSYILHKGPDDSCAKWYKFDDGEVTECKMDDDEEMKNQCFGGEYVGEVFDHMLKRMAYRRQKRWWNAYILILERIDEASTDENIAQALEKLAIVPGSSQLKMPVAIQHCVRKRNLLFMHDMNQFSNEYFKFMKRLLVCNGPFVAMQSPQEKLSAEAEELAMISVRLAAKFLFNVGFHTKKTLRGPAHEWYDALSMHLRNSKNARSWFANNVLFSYPTRFSEYLLECPSSEVRTAFAKIIVFVAHFTLQDGPCPPPLVPGLYGGQMADPNATLSDHLLLAVLNLLKKEVSEHGRHLQQYFHLFLMYASLGIPEKQQLLKLSVPAQFMLVALDEGPGPPIKYQHTELGKLYSVVSLLARCCDVSTRCSSSVQNQPPLPNPHLDQQCSQPLMPIQEQVEDILFKHTNYVKKLIEDCTNSEDTTKLLKFCCWENPHFSSTVLSELLWQVAYTYTYELRPYLDLLLQMLILEDSWQNHRIHNALKGIPEDRDGLFDTIQRAKNHYQKRAYQCIKMLVSLFQHCPPAAQMLQMNGDLKRRWTHAVEWLNDELDRRQYQGNAQYGYNNWSPPAQSNETSNGYFLERSPSARMTLEKAIKLCPREESEDGELTDDQDSPQPDDAVPGYNQQAPSTSQQQPQQQQQQQSSQQQRVPATQNNSGVQQQAPQAPAQQQQQQYPPQQSPQQQSPQSQSPPTTNQPTSGQGQSHMSPRQNQAPKNAPDTTQQTPSPQPQPAPQQQRVNENAETGEDELANGSSNSVGGGGGDH